MALNLRVLKVQMSQKDWQNPQDQGEKDQWLYQRWRVGLSGFTSSAGDHCFSSEYESDYRASSTLYLQSRRQKFFTDLHQLELSWRLLIQKQQSSVRS